MPLGRLQVGHVCKNNHDPQHLAIQMRVASDTRGNTLPSLLVATDCLNRHEFKAIEVGGHSYVMWYGIHYALCEEELPTVSPEPSVSLDDPGFPVLQERDIYFLEGKPYESKFRKLLA